MCIINTVQLLIIEMTIPSRILDFLHRGWEVAAELSVKDPNQRAYIMVIPKVPKQHENPELWIKKSLDVLFGKLILSTSDLIQGYEIRYLRHQAKYTDTNWGWDYDLVLEDPTTRVRRVFIQTEEKLESELIQWLSDLSKLEVSENFDSSLLGSPITSMLDRAEEYPHLWEIL
jgi:hypothetical protein